MNSRERVLRAIAHQRTDHTPANWHAHQEVTDALMRKLGVADHETFLQALGVDLRRISCDYSQPKPPPDADGYVRDLWGARRREQDPGDGRPHWIAPFGEDTTVADVHAHAWPDPAKLDYAAVRAQCEAFRGEYALYGAPWSPFFHEVGWLIGQETFFIWMTTKPEVLQAIIDRVVDYEIAACHRFFEAAGGLIDIAYFGNDFGTQRGLFISPEMFGRFLRRPLKRYFDTARAYGCKVMQHSCGSVRALIPWFIEDGVDMLEPLQVRAAGMDLPGLVRDFGGRLAFHGGVDTQGTLPFGTVADVRAEVRSYLDLTRDRGGYILCGSQEYIADIPLDNLLAIYEENRR